MSTQPVLSGQPPYLRYDVPAELAQIQQKKSALQAAAHPTRGGGIRVADISLAAGLIGVSARASRLVGTASPSASLAARTEDKKTTVLPDGNVSMGFNCSKTFRASTKIVAPLYSWTLYLLDPGSGLELKKVYLGGGAGDSYDFPLDYSTYGTVAFATGSGSFKFNVECTAYTSAPQPTVDTTGDVIINFTDPPCVSLFSLDLDENTFVGGQNNDRPTLTVHLDGPAPPGGQQVILNVSDTNLANIMGDGYFYIPAGQTSGAISRFLGTRRVYQTRTFNITVSVNGGTPGLETIYLHKQ